MTKKKKTGAVQFPLKIGTLLLWKRVAPQDLYDDQVDIIIGTAPSGLYTVFCSTGIESIYVDQCASDSGIVEVIFT